MNSTARYPVVMLVDDNELDNFINKKLLENEMFAETVIVHQSAQTALADLKKLENTPDRLPKIIICDYRLSHGATGVEVIEGLRKN